MAETYTGPGGLRFGVFDWIDDDHVNLIERLETELQMLEYADQHGFYAYHMAEHHGTPLATIGSPNLFFMRLIERTRRLRFGPMVYLLPAYHPTRLVEEIALLDNLSGGRMELGVGRNASPHEAALYGIDMSTTRDVAREVLAIVVQGLETGEIDFEGKHFTLKGIKLRQKALQRPYPPLWWPTVNTDSIPWIAENNMSIFLQSLFITFERMAELLADYHRVRVANAGKPGRLNAHVDRPNCGFTTQIVLAETEADAERLATEAHKVFHGNFTYLWAQQGDAARHAARADFDTYTGQGLMVYGTPETVRTKLQEYLDITGINYLGCTFSFANLQREQVMRSIHMFTEHVMPKLARHQPAGEPS